MAGELLTTRRAGASGALNGFFPNPEGHLKHGPTEMVRARKGSWEQEKKQIIRKAAAA
jgi:hypothetical protein